MNRWTRFWDMHSGGGCKEHPFEKIYIEAPEEEAKRIFFGKFGHNPERVSCTCCGEDYSFYEYDSLEEASAFHRGAPYGSGGHKPDLTATHSLRGERVIPLDEYTKNPDVCVIRADDILPEWRTCEVPEEGYVWVG